MPPSSLEEAVAAFARGGVLVYPTETVYGLGGDPTVPAVLERVRAIKGRDASKPMLVLTDDWGRVAAWIQAPTTEHRRLMTHEPPLAVTLLFRPGPKAPAGLVGPDGWIGIRRTDHPTCLGLIAGAGRPLLSTSANPGGAPPPRTFEAIDPALLGAVDAALDAGAPLAGVPSTVAHFEGGALTVVREGAVTRADIKAFLAGEN